MSVMEQKLDALIRMVTAEDSITQARAKAEVLELMKQGEKAEQTIKPMGLKHEVRALLTKLGMPEHIKGHRYCVEAICQCVVKPEMIEVITKGLYPAVATVFETTPNRVERAIRHAVEVTWDRCDEDVAYKCFGSTVSNRKGKPTNSEFLARVSGIIRERMERKG